MLLERVGRRKAALRTPDVWLNQPTTQRNTYPEAAWHIYTADGTISVYMTAEGNDRVVRIDGESGEVTTISENPENPEAISSDGSFISEGAVARDFTSS